jgi:Domain of unknown function (DUF222)
VGYGPLPASIARELAGDANWRRLVIDPVSGHLLDYGRSTYRPPKALVDYLRARDRTCRFPGCPRAAARCDIDHTIAFKPGARTGGSTSSTNCSCLCRFHHRLKTHGKWGMTLDADGTVTWAAPTGHTYRTLPADLGPPSPAPPIDDSG